MPSMLKDHFADDFEIKKRRSIKLWMNSYENFFKHADHDPDPNATIEFNPEVTEIFLIDAWGQMEKLIGEMPFEGKAFRAWTGKPKPGTPPVICSAIASLKGKSKTEFYSIFTTLYELYSKQQQKPTKHLRSNQ
jgi:hypothetical protein